MKRKPNIFVCSTWAPDCFYRVGQKRFVLGCVMSPLRQQAESRNLGHTFWPTLDFRWLDATLLNLSCSLLLLFSLRSMGDP